MLKVLNLGNDANIVNLTDDIPEVLFGPKVEGKFQEGATLPFYISLNIHDQILHNAMLDSGASHNLMPKVVMERLGWKSQDHTKNYIHLIQVESNAWV